ncbi:MAG TPA: helix-turn-helix domain-containing protein [Chthoniobacteraceae bacterium]|nr:helix-turn-helix domain-containing protein [Chthoniobacteraceae bacterium]
MVKTRPQLSPLQRAAAERQLERLETLVETVRRCPADFADAAAMAGRFRMKEERFARLCREHYHALPEELLFHARLEEAQRRLGAGEGSLAAVAKASGFASVRELRSAFLRRLGLSPEGYAGLKTAEGFTLRLPPAYPMEMFRHAIGRDPTSLTDQLEDNRFTMGLMLAGEPTRVALALSPTQVNVSAAPSPGDLRELHARVVGMLGLGQPTGAFTARARELGLERLTSVSPELRIHQTQTLYDGLLWTIIGQQINLPFACVLRRRLVELTGVPLGGGRYAFPTPEAVAKLEIADLLPHQFSRQKADYVVSISRLVASGELDLEGLRRMSATRVERTLKAIRGLGPWSVHYLMMRSLGFADCLPLGDTGVTSGLWKLFKTPERPDAKATLQLMAPFSPYRSLATAHLWHFER